MPGGIGQCRHAEPGPWVGRKLEAVSAGPETYGRSPLIGNITCPEMLWAVDLGARKTLFSLRPGAGPENIIIPAGGENGDPSQTSFDFQVDGDRIDLDGDGNELVDSSEHGVHKVGEFLPGLEGYERISCGSEVVFGDEDANEPQPCYLDHRVDRAWERVWTSEPLRAFRPNSTSTATPIVSDMDADGELETAVIGWHDLHVFDLATGYLETTVTFFEYGDDPENVQTPRPYGWLGSANLDDDPEEELVAVSHSERHIWVFDYDGNSLKKSWEYEIERGTSDNQTTHRPPVNPVADIDGDGFAEIITSVYNQGGDDAWHVLVLDGRTGEVEVDLKDHYLSGLGDLDNDQIA